MQTEHTETVVEKVTTYVKDMLGIPHDRSPDVDAKPDYSEIAPALHFGERDPELNSNDAMLREPGAFTTKTVGEMNAESARREDGE